MARPHLGQYRLFNQAFFQRKEHEKERREHDKDKERRKLSADEMEIERALLLKRQRSLSVPKSATAHLVFDEKGDLARVYRTPSSRRPREISPPDGHGSTSSGSPVRRLHLAGEHNQSKAQQLQHRRSSLKRRSSNTTLLPKQSLTDSSKWDQGFIGCQWHPGDDSCPISDHSPDHLVTLATSESSSRRHSTHTEAEANGRAHHGEVSGGDISL